MASVQFPPVVGLTSGLRGKGDQEVSVHSTQPPCYEKELQKQVHSEQVTAKTKTKTRANSNSLHETVDIGLALSINPELIYRGKQFYLFLSNSTPLGTESNLKFSSWLRVSFHAGILNPLAQCLYNSGLQQLWSSASVQILKR